MTNNLKLFFDNFDKLSESPNGIQKLRELILQLAVQGKLVPQNPNDEPASELLKKIKSEKEKLIKEGKIKKQKPLPPINPDEAPYKLPQSWEWVRLGGIVDYTGAPKVSPDEIPDSAWLLELEDIMKDTSIILKRVLYKERLSKSTKAKFLKGDVLYGKLRPYLNKVVVADTDGYCTTEIIPLRGYYNIFPEYLKYSLKRPDFLNYANSKTYGVKMPRLGTNDARCALIPLPSFSEQKRIVAKVDELMALCDELEAKQNKAKHNRVILNDSALDHLLNSENAKDFNKYWHLICDSFDLLYDDLENVDKLRQTILQLAVQGKLVSQDPSDEPASELLKKIKAEKEKLIKKGKIKKQKPLPQIEPDEIPYELPDGWEWSRMESLCTLITDGAHHTPNYVTNGIPFLSVKDISSGKISFSNTRFISEEAHVELTKRCNPQINDILLTKVGTTGIAVVVDTEKQFSLFVSIALLKTVKEYNNPYYLELLINSPLVKQYSKKGTEGIGNKNLVLRKIKAFILPIPPLAEQKRIVKKVDELMALCDELAESIKQSQAKSENLMAATIHHLLHRPLPEKQTIPDKKKSQTPYKDDAAVACLLLQEMKKLNRPTNEFFIQKHMFITKHHLHLPINSLFVRKVAGPWSHELRRKAIFAATKMNWLRWEKNRLVAGSAFEKALSHSAIVLGEDASLIAGLVKNLQRFQKSGLERWTTVLKVVEDLKGTQQPVTRSNIQREINTWPGKSLKKIFVEESVDYTIDKMLKHKWLAPIDKP